MSSDRARGGTRRRLDRALGRDLGEPATIELDATQLEVDGGKAGRQRSQHGFVSYAPHIAFGAQHGRTLTASWSAATARS